MSASDEVDEMHLTPSGWVQGSEKIDFSGWTHRDPPADRLLTVRFREHMSSAFSKMDLSAEETCHAPNDEIVAALVKHGTDPRHEARRYRGWSEFLARVGFQDSPS
jgi:hypothetical protein